MIARIVASGALVVGMVAVGGAAHANTGPVPPEWGPPDVGFAKVAVVGRDDGRLPGRLGNQHVTAVDTIDEDSVVRGFVLDWWCPAGQLAPAYPWAETSCRLKSQLEVQFDYDGTFTQNWAQNLRYLNFRIPIKLVDTSGTVVDRGMVTLHLKGSGDVEHTWFEGDYLDIVSRQATLTGGHFFGRPWSALDSVEIAEGQMWLERYYNP